MSRLQPPGGATVETLLEDLLSYYREGAVEGWGGVCRQAALTHRALQLLDTGVPLGLHVSEDMAPAPLGGCSQGDACPQLVPALEFLELVSVNLLLFPWRKEIRSLKTYTGSFTYWVQPVLSKGILDSVLGRLGYVATSEAEFSLVQPISEDAVKWMLFDIFLARVACETTFRATGKQVPRPDRERCARALCRRGSGRRLGRAHIHLRGAPPGLWGGAGPERAMARDIDGQYSLPKLLNLPSVASAASDSPLNDPPVPLGHQLCTSTHTDSEEFLSCYSDLGLHQTPLCPRDSPPHSPLGNQLWGPAPASSPLSGEVAVPSGGSWGQPLVTGSQLSRGELQRAGPGTDAAPHSVSSEMDELCEQLSHLFGPPVPTGHQGGLA